MLKKIFVVTMVLLSFSSLAFSATDNNSLIRTVKNYENKLKVPCSELPRIIKRTVNEANRDTRDSRKSSINYKWKASRSGKHNKVWLSFVVVTRAAFDTVTFSYSWKPNFVWIVDKMNKKVIAANELTRLWMETGSLRKP